jgi:hypothetical protein
LRFPARRNPQRTKVSLSTSVPAPTLGLNAKDDIAGMDPRFALKLRNAFPEADRLTVRKGHIEHGTDMTDPVESLMPWAGSSNIKLIAATEDTLWDTTSAGAASSLETSFTNGRWQYTNFSTSGGHFLVMVNGADAPQKYDGSTISETTITGSGLTATNLINIASHKSRIWLIEKDSMNAWYLGTEAIAGTASKFPLGSVFNEGGYLVAAGTYSDDAGEGIEDYLAFISSMGEVLLYQGTDPASANTWSLAGRFKTGSPLGRRCIAKMGGDLLFLTEAGVISMKAMLKYDRAQQEFSSVSDKIDPLVTEAARRFKDHFGWQIMTHPRAKWLVVNVPTSEGVSQYQYIMNTITGAWCDFDGLNANVFASTGDNVYFGGNDGTVYEADYLYDDNGSKIDADIKTAFNYFNSRGTEKHFTMIRPVLSSTGVPTLTVGASVDYDETEPSGDLTPAQQVVAEWDNANWDEDVWGGISLVTRKWTGLKKVGMCMAINMRISIRGGACAVNSFDVVAEPGGTI